MWIKGDVLPTGGCDPGQDAWFAQGTTCTIYTMAWFIVPLSFYQRSKKLKVGAFSKSKRDQKLFMTW